jgi:hypothetical protein
MIVRPVEYIIGRLDGRFAPQTTLCHIDATTRKENRKMIIIYLVLFVHMKILTIMIILLEMIILTKHLEPVWNEISSRRDHWDSPFIENKPMKHNNADRMGFLREMLDEIPPETDIETAKSVYNNGMLEITSKKKEQTKPKGKQINIE